MWQLENSSESDRRYAVELLMKIGNSRLGIERQPKGNWCGSVLSSLLRDGYVQIIEHTYGQFYVPTGKGRECINQITQEAFLEKTKMILLTISFDDYEEIINGLETVISDRCGSERERKDVQDIIDRVEASQRVLGED